MRIVHRFERERQSCSGRAGKRNTIGTDRSDLALYHPRYGPRRTSRHNTATALDLLAFWSEASVAKPAASSNLSRPLLLHPVPRIAQGGKAGGLRVRSSKV